MSVYYPSIPGYAPFYVQMKTAQTATNLLTEYGCVINSHSYPANFTVKEPYKNEWFDEDGDDEYIPSTGLHLEAFTFTQECCMLFNAGDSAASRAALASQYRSLADYLHGGEFSFFDDWTKIGYRNVRLSSISTIEEEAFKATTDGKVLLRFSITFKVNDPITKMKLLNGAIVTA